MIEDAKLSLKKKFLEYYEDVPMQKFAAMYIGRNEDTICIWKAEDPDFSDRIDNLKAKFVQQKLKEVKNMEWKLERIFKQEFSQRSELTGADGKDLPTPILGSIIQQDKVV